MSLLLRSKDRFLRQEGWARVSLGGVSSHKQISDHHWLLKLSDRTRESVLEKNKWFN